MNLFRKCYAHTLPGRPEEEWHGLFEHLESVSERAAAMGDCFGAGDWARVAGLWHDLGKYSDAFQEYLRAVSSPDSHIADTATRTDHSTAGAQHAVASIDVLGHLIAYAIAGHHSGLPDGRSGGPCLEARLAKAVESWNRVPASLVAAQNLKLPDFVEAALGRGDAFCVAFFVRMLFSCLVDSDFLDTEQFMNPERTAERPAWPPNVLQQMEAALDEYVTELESESMPVNIERAKVREACLSAAARKPGLFSLTVPTGGGKTLSSLAFALRHAQLHDLRRVVYVIPLRNATFSTSAPSTPCSMDPGDPNTASHLETRRWPSGRNVRLRLKTSSPNSFRKARPSLTTRGPARTRA